LTFAEISDRIHAQQSTNTKMKNTNQIDQIVDNLDKRHESSEYIVEYLKDVIKGLQRVAPRQVNAYLEITLHNQQNND